MKQDSYAALNFLLNRHNITAENLAEGLGIKLKYAKDLVNGKIERFEESAIIEVIAAIIHLRLLNGAS